MSSKKDDTNPFDGDTISGTMPKAAQTDKADDKANDTDEQETKSPAKPSRKDKSAKKKVDYNERVWALFHESEDMPVHGIPVSVNGTAFLIQPGKPVKVPRYVLRAIDNAVAERPVQDAAGGKVRGYRRVQRFTYTLISDPDE